MISENDIVIKITEYLQGDISGKALVNYIDEVVSSDSVYTYSDKTILTVMNCQDEMAFYVENESLRAEHPSYFGPDKLKVLAMTLKRALLADLP